MVVMIDGKAAADQYRRFKIQSLEGIPNDYLAMQEVIRRRFTRGLREHQGEIESTAFSEFPDLVVIDGGKGQLSSAVAVRDQLELTMPFISLAEKHEEIILKENRRRLFCRRNRKGCTWFNESGMRLIVLP